MRRQAVRGVKSGLGVEQLRLRERLGIEMRFDERQIRLGQLLFDDGHILRLRLRTLDARDEWIVFEVEAVRDRLQVLHLQVFTRENQAVGVVVVDDNAAIAVEYLAARREYRDRLNAVLLSLFQVARRVAHLQVPEPPDQQYTDPHRQALAEGALASCA